MRPSISIVIAGVGNLLLSDDGVGVHAIRALQRDPIPGVRMIEIGTAVLHGVACVEDAGRILVIDAARGGQPPGSIYLFDSEAEATLPAFSSMHAMGLKEALRFLSPAGAMPRITVLGVEPESLAYGMELSPRLEAALPQVIHLARETVLRWNHTTATSADRDSRSELRTE